jgi:XTP/dITP diphosphohydrolase
MIIYLATGNRHKKIEMAKICKEHTILIPSDKNIVFNPVENGATFSANSLIKAESLWNQVHQTVLADDSGICIDALDGIPGIYSARYAGISHPQGYPGSHEILQSEQNRMIIDHTNIALEKKYGSKLAVMTKKDRMNLRSCHYVCAMTLYISKDVFYCVQETFEGQLLESLDEQRGSGGFGYDPIIYLPEYDKTIAELDEGEKNKISHRGKASRKILQLL